MSSKSLIGICIITMFLYVLIPKHVSAQLVVCDENGIREYSICNEDYIRKESIEETSINKDGFVKVKKTLSYENRGGNCLLLIQEGFDTSSEINIKNWKFYDNEDLTLEPIVTDAIFLINHNKDLEGGRVYKFFFEYELEEPVKYPDKTFYFGNRLQVSGKDKTTLILIIENREPWWDIKFDEITPPQTRDFNNNVLIWELEASEPMRIVKESTIRYRYILNWNIISPMLVGTLIGIIFGRLVSNVFKSGESGGDRKNIQTC